jgi:2-methylcitrate dehydratase PrpD
MMRDIDHPTMVKHGIGWGAMTGIMAAQLAAEGFTGIPSILGFEKYREWVTDIGQKYIMVEGVTFKRFASCLWGHPSLQAAMKLMADYPIELTQIARIKVFGFHEMVRLGTAIPETEEQAQFSVAWPLAALLAEGELGPQQMLKKRYGDSTITDLVHRIELVETDEMNRLHSNYRYPSIVEIILKDGTRFTSDIEFYYNSDHSGERDTFGDIWKPAEVRAKFRWVCAGAVKAEIIDSCLELRDHFEELPDVMTLTDLLSSRARI